MFKAPFSFNGRIRRIEYLLTCIFGGIAISISFWLGVAAALVGSGSFSFGVFIGFAVLIAGGWFLLAQDVKRLHDANKSGMAFVIGTDTVGQHCIRLVYVVRRRNGRSQPLRAGSQKPHALPSTTNIGQCHCQYER